MTASLTAERLRELLHYDRATGLFTWLKSNSNRVKVGSIAGSLRKDGYIEIGVDGERHLAHRLAVLYVTGNWPPEVVDHKFANRSDNRWSEIRAGTQSFNCQNIRSARKDSSTGLLGASPACDNSGKFIAHIKYGGKVRHLGRFDSAEEAHEAYIKAKRQHHEGNLL